MLKSWLNEFKKFALKGNVIDMAVGIIIGAAFGKIVDSLVKDILLPPISLLMGTVDFGNLFFVLPVDVYDKELAVAFVLLEVLVGYAIQDFALVGRYHRVAHSAECHKHLGRHNPVLHFHGLFADNVAGFSGRLTGCHQ